MSKVRSAKRKPNPKQAVADDGLRRSVDESIRDPRPSTPAREVFKRLRAYHAGSVPRRKG